MGTMKNWTIGKRLTLGFAGVILITVCVSIYAFTRLEAIQSQAVALANDSLPGAVLMGQIAALSEREVALVLQHIKANDAQDVEKTGPLRVYMGYLREKLENNPAKPELLVTEPGVGYRLVLQD